MDSLFSIRMIGEAHVLWESVVISWSREYIFSSGDRFKFGEKFTKAAEANYVYNA